MSAYGQRFATLSQGGDQWDLALLLLNSGLEEALAASPTAGSLLAAALRSWQQLGSTVGVAFALAGLGEIAARNGRHAGPASCSAQAGR